MRRTYWLLSIPFLFSLAYLAFGEKPWHGALDAISESLAAKERPDWLDDTVLGLYGAAGINAFLCLLLAATARFWTRPVSLRPAPSPPPAAGLAPRVFWIGLAVAMILAGALRWNFAHGSLWWDEIWNARQAVVGQWKQAKNPKNPPKFSPSTYKRAAFYYQKPTNHIPAALASKVSHDLWTKASHAPKGALAEFPYRLPNFLISLGSVLAIGVLIRRWGFASAGVLAAFLMALHPWAIRYGVDMRAYSGLVLLTLLGCLWLTRIAQTDGKPWRYWHLFGLNQFLLVWALPNAVWYAMAFFIALLVVILRRGGGGNALYRLLAVNTFAAMALFAVGGPAIVQTYRWIQDLYQPHLITGDLLRTTASELFYGLPWFWPESPEAAGLPSLVSRAGGTTGLVLVWLVPVAFLLTGFFRSIMREKSVLPGLTAVAGATAFYLWFTYRREELFYPRYIIYVLGPYIALLAIGVDAAARRLFRQNTGAALAVALVIGAGGFAFFVEPSLRLLSTRSYAPFREVADWINANAPENARVFGHGLGGRELDAYFPAVRWNPSNAPENLRAEIDSANEAGAPFYAVFGYTGFNHATFPESSALLDDSAAFEEVAAFPGIEPEFYFRILRLRPPAASASTSP